MSRTHVQAAPDEVVEALLSFFPTEEPRFSTDMEKIHGTFYGLKKDYPDIFAGFVFDTDRSFPYCRDIEFAFRCLSAAALIRTQNTYLEKFLIAPQLSTHYKDVTKKKVKVDEDKLQEISQKLRAALSS